MAHLGQHPGPPDPSSTIAPELLPHIHLLSTFRYPVRPRIEIAEVAKWLLDAPKIARDKNGFFWTYLEKPMDGTILMTWQPARKLGNEFASDGYVWTPMEQFYQQELPNGAILEIYMQKAGFAPGEPMATHSRRRFRLVPPKVPVANPPQIDPNLWIVHWGPLDGNDRIPSAMISFDARVQQSLQTRNYLQKCGQIHRKEFMLSDKVNWPTLHFPQQGGPRYAQPPNPRPVPQQMAYPPHHPGAMAGPPNKRLRPAPQGGPGGPGPQSGHMGPGAPMPPPQDHVFEDDEDTSRGDSFDQLTNREISLARYQQNHDWMEEVLASPYAMGQIAMADLGLGLKGELSGLTEGLLPPTDKPDEADQQGHSGRLDPAKAELFRKRVEEHIRKTREETARLEASHAKALARFRGSVVSKGEKELREAQARSAVAVAKPAAGDDDDMDDAQAPLSLLPAPVFPHPRKSEDAIIAQVEAALGRSAVPFPEVRRVQNGGYIEPAPEPEPELEPEPVVPAVVVPKVERISPVPTPPQPGLSASLATVAGPSAATPASAMSRQPSQAASSLLLGGGADSEDVDMGGTAASLLDQIGGAGGVTTTGSAISAASTPLNIPSAAATPADNAPAMAAVPAAAAAAPTADIRVDAAAADDWVVVPKGGVSPGPDGQASAAPAMTTAGAAAPSLPAAGNPADDDGFDDDEDDEDEDDEDDDEGDDDEADPMDLAMDDSAFGDAFHAPSNAGGDDSTAQTPADAP